MAMSPHSLKKNYMSNIELRVCRTCKIEKPFDLFSKDKRNKNGISAQCKSCENNRKRKASFDGRIVENKNCYICEVTKSRNEFYSDKSRQDGLANKCKDCHNEYRDNNREKINKDKRECRKQIKLKKLNSGGKVCLKCNEYKPFSEYHKHYGPYSYCNSCKEKLAEESKITLRNRARKYREDNIEKFREFESRWRKNKMKDPIARMRANASKAILTSIKKYNSIYKKLDALRKAAFDHLPYTAQELKAHIESLWEPWMNWDNHGKASKDRMTWQIDHIIPQSILPFDSFIHPNFQKCWALENLRPLESIANIRKGNRLIDIDKAA